jgi:hypothetical protein
VYAIPVTIAVTGSAASEVRFLQLIQGPGGRAVLVTSTQLSGASADGSGGANLTIQLQAFAAPQGAHPTPTATAPSGS